MEDASGRLRLTPWGPSAHSSDVSANLRGEAPFDVRGLAVSAAWFSHIVGDGLTFTAQEGGPDFRDELTAVRVGLALLLGGLVLSAFCVGAWMFRRATGSIDRRMAFVLLAAGLLMLGGLVVQSVALFDMAKETGDEIEAEGDGLAADARPGSALFLLVLASLSTAAAAVLALLRRSEPVPPVASAS